jgi:glutathione S-transferase
MVLYTCGEGTRSRSFGGLLAHPCGRAAKALDDGGHLYETKVVRGYTSSPWTWPSRGRERAEVKELSGKSSVPILVLEDGQVIAGSRQIVRWATENPPVPRARVDLYRGAACDGSRDCARLFPDPCRSARRW